jgi:hypothetical protein
MTMKNRPDKPGCWFFENTDSRVFPIIVVEKPCNVGSGIALNVVFRMRYFYLEAFENLAGFKRWIGQAHPPKLESATVHEMVSQWIARNGADGLWNEEGPCGCDGSAPCGDGPYPKCKAAVAVDEDGNGVDFLYYPVTILPYWDSND